MVFRLLLFQPSEQLSQFPESIALMNLLRALEFGASAVLLYELAHIAVAHALKVKIYRVGINWRGVFIQRQRALPSQNLAIALAGPSLTLALAALFRSTSPDFSLCALLVCVANLLPLPDSDGLRALRIVQNLDDRSLLAEPASTRVLNISEGRRRLYVSAQPAGSGPQQLRRFKPQYDRVRITSGPYKGRFIGARVAGFVGPEISISNTVYSLHDQARVAARFFDRTATQVQTELKSMGLDSELV